MRKTALLLAATLPMAVQAANVEFKYGGFIKLDAMYSQYSDGVPASASAVGRDYNVPHTLPTSSNNSDSVGVFDMHAKSSRFNFGTTLTLDNGEKVTSFIEMDFFGSGHNEATANGYGPRLRHAFLTYNGWTLGQTWSTFMNPAALPEAVDFVGVSDGTIFIRQPQIRYTSGNWMFAIENPETTSTVNLYSDAAAHTPSSAGHDVNRFPDLVARYNFKVGEHAFTLAALGRDLSVRDSQFNVESAVGYGVSATGVLKFGRDSLHLSISQGNIGRYTSVGGVRDVYLDSDNGEVEVEPSSMLAAYIGYRHFWNDQWRTTVSHAFQQADYHEDLKNDTSLTKETSSSRINLMYSPTAAVTYGVEYSYQEREVMSGNDGNLHRLQFTSRFNF